MPIKSDEIKATVEAALSRIVTLLKKGNLDKEQQVIQSTIIPILNALGWSTDDREQVAAEYSVRKNNRVDIALLHNEKARIFIEVKLNLDKITTDIEDQAFKYAYLVGVPILILADGKKWSFYYPVAEGEPADRVFHELDITDTPIQECVDIFCEFLSRAEVTSGRATTGARKVIEAGKMDSVEKILPKAWKSILEESSDFRERLKGELQDKVEQECGHLPSDETIEKFLSAQTQKLQKEESALSSISTTSKSIKPLEMSTKHGKKSAESLIHQKIIGFILNEKIHQAESGIDAALNTLALFHQQDKSFLEKFSKKWGKSINRNTGTLFPTQPAEYANRWSKRIPIKGKNWYLNARLSNDGIGSVLKRACNVIGMAYGEDFRVITEPKKKS